MILSMSGQAVIFLATVASGFCIGFAFDCLRALRRAIPHPDFLTQIEDIIFWIAAALIMFYVMLNLNYGEIRFYSIMGAALGMILYFASLSRLVMALSMAIINLIRKIIHALINILLAPFRLLRKIMRKPCAFCARKSKNALNNAIKVLKKNFAYGKIRKSAKAERGEDSHENRRRVKAITHANKG